MSTVEDGRPSMTQTLLSVATVMAQRSTCSLAHVGAVVARDGRILASGYNGAPATLPHCAHLPGEDSCPVSVHAEANAIAFAARYGVALENASLYCTHSPCLKCAQLIINAGIAAVFYRELHHNLRGLELLRGAFVKACRAGD